METAGRAFEENARPSPEHAQAVLKQRAQALARPMAPPAAGDVLNLITFTLREEVYAIESRFVLEVFRPVEVAPLPAAEPTIFGVTVWRGELLLVGDLRALLGLSSGSRSAHPMLLAVGRERPVLALPADAPGDMRVVPAHALRPPPEGLAAREYLRGMTADAVMVLDVERVLHVAGPEPA